MSGVHTSGSSPGGFALHDRVALITGGAGGIGLAVARRFAQAGAQLALADIRLDAARQAADSLVRDGHQVIGLGGDVSRSADAEALVRGALERFGRIDILVNNAGRMGRVAPLWELRDEDWSEVLAVDLTSVFLVSRAVVPHMRARRRGCIVSVSSIAGKEGTPNLIPYSVAKAGIIAFTKAIARENARYGITANAIAPGPIETPLLMQAKEFGEIGEKVIETMKSATQIGRLGQPDEVAAAAAFLASDDATYVTGETLGVSGGLGMV